MDIIKDIILPYLLGAATISGLFFFFGKNIFLHILSKDIEKYKTQLSEKTEVLKTHLAMFTYEQNVTFSRIDKQRAKAISLMFLSMRKWIKPVIQIISDFPIVNASDESYFQFYKDRGEDAYKLSKKMSDILGNNSIYFDEDLYQNLVTMTVDCLKMTASFLHPIRKGIGEGLPFEETKEDIEIERKKLELYYSKHIPLAQKITTNFRVLLGSMKVR